MTLGQTIEGPEKYRKGYLDGYAKKNPADFLPTYLSGYNDGLKQKLKEEVSSVQDPLQNPGT